MDKVSNEQLDALIDFAAEDARLNFRAEFYARLNALTELRDRRQADEAPDYSTKSQPSPMGLYRCNKRSYRRQAEKTIDKSGA